MKQSIIRKILPLLKFLRDYKGFVILIAICTILFVLFLTGTLILSEKPNEFGDSAGATNGLFSALAFAGVIYAIFLQKNELELQRQELKDTRKEIAGQRKESELQNETLRRQRFENTFFQMMSLQQEIIDTLSCTCRIRNELFMQIEKYRGREIFKALYEADMVSYEDSDGKPISYSSLKDALLERHYAIFRPANLSSDGSTIELPPIDYSPYNKAAQPQYLDHYFRHLYRMVKFIDETKLLPDDFNERYQYTSMIRATFSRYEFVWLYYNGLSDNGIKFKSLMEKYALLRGIRLDMLAIDGEKQRYQNLLDTDSIDSTNSDNFYNKSAFVKTQPRT